jgi:hypothetical protein
VTDRVKIFIGKLSLWVRKLRGKCLKILSHMKDFMEENTVERSDTGIDQCIKDDLITLQSRLSKYSPEAVSDKCKWITDPFHADSSQNYEFCFQEEQTYISFICDAF